jgi:hypothetical protein
MSNATIKLRHLCPSLRPSTKQLGIHWKDVCEIWYYIIFRKSFEKFPISSKFDENNGYFKLRPVCIYENFWLSFFRIRTDSDKCFRENHNSFNGQ